MAGVRLTEPEDVVPTRARQPIDDVIDSGVLETLFQPVVHLVTRAVVGFEALSRGPAGTSLEAPMAMLDAARRVGRLAELDWLMRTRALLAARRARLHPSLAWFVNVEPSGLETKCPPDLLALCEGAQDDLRVVLEVVDPGVGRHATGLLVAADRARADSWGVALADVGADDGSIGLLPLLQPDVVKLDVSQVEEPLGPRMAIITAAVRAHVERTGAVLVAEGIETDEQASFASALGAVYGQGHLFGMPAPLPVTVPAPREPVPLRQRPVPLGGATPFSVVKAARPSRHLVARHMQHMVVQLLHQSRSSEYGAVLLLQFADEQDWLRHREDVASVAATNAMTICLVPGLRAAWSGDRLQIRPLDDAPLLADDRTAVLLTPHHAAAVVARTVAGSGWTALLDHVYTSDRDLVVAAARAFLAHLDAAEGSLLPLTRPDVEDPPSAPVFRVRPVRRWRR